MAGVPDGGSTAAPYFFLSYAHTPRGAARDGDPDALVDRLYRDLCDHIMQLTDLPSGTNAGFMDRRMDPGGRWSEQLSDALAHCRVFVPLYSRRYFHSDQCGKEWYAFSQRAAYQQPSDGPPLRGMVPALWVPVPPQDLPGPAESLQFDHADFGSDYTTEGLYGLIKLSCFKEEYETAVYRLAQRIVSIAEGSAIGPGRRMDYREAPSAFGPPGGPHQLRISVLACSRKDLPAGRSEDSYGATPLDWNPYQPKSRRAIAVHTEDLAHHLDFRARARAFEEDLEQILASGTPSAPGVLLVDRWTLADARRRELLKRFDAEDRPWISVMIPWNRDDPDSTAREDELRELLNETLQRKLQEGSTDYRLSRNGIPTLEAFYDDLPKAVSRAAGQYRRHAATYPPPGPHVPRPRLLGPVAPGGYNPPPDPPLDKAEDLDDREP
jgi:FxsC-like protein